MPKKSPNTENSTKQDIFWIREPRQLEALISQRRQEIEDYLATAGPKSVKEIAAALGMKPSALYHHIDILREVGLIREVESRIVNRRTEKVYDTPAKLMRWGITPKDPSKRELWHKLNAAQCRQTDRDFAAGIARADSVESGPERNLRSFRLVGAPDRKTLIEINRRIDEIAELMWQSAGNDEQLIALSCVMAPVSESPPQPEKPSVAARKKPPKSSG